MQHCNRMHTSMAMLLLEPWLRLRRSLEPARRVNCLPEQNAIEEGLRGGARQDHAILHTGAGGGCAWAACDSKRNASHPAPSRPQWCNHKPPCPGAGSTVARSTRSSMRPRTLTITSVVNTRARLPASDSPVEIMDSSPELPRRML